MEGETRVVSAELRKNHGEGIGLFASAATGAPDHEGSADSPSLLKDHLRQDFLNQVIEMGGLPKKIRLVRRDGVHHMNHLFLKTLGAEQVFAVFLEILHVQGSQPFPESGFEHKPL